MPGCLKRFCWRAVLWLSIAVGEHKARLNNLLTRGVRVIGQWPWRLVSGWGEVAGG